MQGYFVILYGLLFEANSCTFKKYVSILYANRQLNANVQYIYCVCMVILYICSAHLDSESPQNARSLTALSSCTFKKYVVGYCNLYLD
jgi:hypothetical protein